MKDWDVKESIEPVMLYATDPTTNRAQRRAGHKSGVFVPNSKNQPAIKTEDGSYVSK